MHFLLHHDLWATVVLLQAAAAAASPTKYVVAISVLAAALALLVALMAWLQRHKLRNTLVRVSWNLRRMLAGRRTKPLNHPRGQPVRDEGQVHPSVVRAHLVFSSDVPLITGGASFSFFLTKTHQVYETSVKQTHGPPFTPAPDGLQSVTLFNHTPEVVSLGRHTSVF